MQALLLGHKLEGMSAYARVSTIRGLVSCLPRDVLCVSAVASSDNDAAAGTPSSGLPFDTTLIWALLFDCMRVIEDTSDANVKYTGHAALAGVLSRWAAFLRTGPDPASDATSEHSEGSQEVCNCLAVRVRHAAQCGLGAARLDCSIPAPSPLLSACYRSLLRPVGWMAQYGFLPANDQPEQEPVFLRCRH